MDRSQLIRVLAAMDDDEFAEISAEARTVGSNPAADLRASIEHKTAQLYRRPNE